ncbi:hypothetical protein HC928_05020 [bacterium]|nr:hypothetical protein [bacterium]
MRTTRIGINKRVPCIERLPSQSVDCESEQWWVKSEWRVWLDTRDFIHGTYLALRGDGSAYRVTVRESEGDEYLLIKPGDERWEVIL